MLRVSSHKFLGGRKRKNRKILALCLKRRLPFEESEGLISSQLRPHNFWGFEKIRKNDLTIQSPVLRGGSNRSNSWKLLVSYETGLRDFKREKTELKYLTKVKSEINSSKVIDGLGNLSHLRPLLNVVTQTLTIEEEIGRFVSLAIYFA